MSLRRLILVVASATLFLLGVLAKNDANIRHTKSGEKERREMKQHGTSEWKIEGKYQSRNASDLCGDQTPLTSDNGTVTSPGYPNDYPAYTNCSWRISAPADKVILIEFTEFVVEDEPSCEYDSVRIYDGESSDLQQLAVFCGTDIPAAIVTTGSEALVTFVSDYNVQYSGFSFTYSFVESTLSEDLCANQTPLTSDTGTVTSPGYPYTDYPAYANCSRRISAPADKVILIEFTDFAVEVDQSCLFDSLSIYDGESRDTVPLLFSCGLTLPPPITTSGSEAMVIFVSDYSVQLSGFSFTYSFVDDVLPGNKTSGCGTHKPAVLTHEEGTFFSPGHGANQTYPNNADCAWRIEVPESKRASIHFVSFSLEGWDYCPYDRVEIYDGPDETGTFLGKHCGGDIPGDIVASGNMLYVTFTSDATVTFPGFEVEYSGKDITVGPSGGCGNPEIQPKFARIVGGTEAQAHSWPWQISMKYSGIGWEHWCGGSIIDPLWVITAAHCTYGLGGATNFKVTVGEHNLESLAESSVETIEVEQIIEHEQYDEATYDSDIALLKLKTPVTYSREVSPVCLPSVDIAVNSLCVTTGWGATQGTGDSAVLNQVYVPIIDTNECNHPDWYNGEITTNMLCAGYPEGQKDSCQGDSGGPLVCSHGDEFKIHGLTSWGYNCAEAKHPGVYTRVTRFLQWIEQHSGVRP